jgi:hypothetical protein
MQTGRRIVLAVIVALCSRSASATTIDFESFVEGDVVTNQIVGVTFSNATVLTAGVGLNEFEFPPHSGDNVVFDDGGAISLSFASPLASFGGYFTYAAPITLQAFSPTNVLLATVTSAFSNNTGDGGDVGSSPNEFLQFGAAGGVGSVTITGDVGGSSFVLDDVVLTPLQTGPGPDPTPVPEPATILLTLSGIAVLPRMVRKRCSSSTDESVCEVV